jgi:large subunit ribosomal protein L13
VFSQAYAVDTPSGLGYLRRLSQNHLVAINRLEPYTNQKGAGTSTFVSPDMKTYSATPRDIQHQWYIVDADGVVLGRLATEVAKIIRGKHKPMYTPHMDTGDNVIVINASKVRVTGKKAEQKRYFRHTGYMGHERFIPFEMMLAKHPERVIEKAVYGMLPKTALGRQKLRNKLRVFADAKHTHAAQQPKVLDLNKKSEK